MRYLPLLLSAAFFAVAPTLAYAADAPTSTPVPAADAASTSSAHFTDTQRSEIEGIIKEYLTNKNPEVMMEGLQNLQAKQNADAATRSKTALTQDHDKVYSDPTSPIGGNPKGDVTLVEFFDYQCGYCKLAEPGVEKLIKSDKDLKFVYKEFPILGPSSVLASKAALASIKQGDDKYIKFHDALMAANFSHGAKPQEDEDMIYKTAKSIGLNVDKLKKDMDDDSVNKMIEANVALGGEVGARGTPTFIINDSVYPGAMEADELKKKVDEARAAKKK